MRFRVGLADVSAALIVAVIVVMPSRSAKVHHAYRDPGTLEAPDSDKLRELARLQAALVKNPPDAGELDRMVDLLVEHGQSDEAVRLARDAMARGARPAWQAELALASAFIERLELATAQKWANKAWENAPRHERAKIDKILRELTKGLEALDKGIDPRREPERFRDYVQEVRPPVRVN